MSTSNYVIPITIGIVAHNEEANIANLLSSVLKQVENGYSIREILIISDGSTDKTNEIIQSFEDPRIQLIASQERIGKSKHLNTIFNLSQGEIVVLFDADVILANKSVIHYLISPIKRSSHVGLVGGNPQPVKGSTFIENSVNATFKVYDTLRVVVKEGHNAFGCDGRILALSKNFFKSIEVPPNMIANGAYMYFSCITKGFTFKHSRKAVVYYRSPTTLHDHLRQNKRFIAAHQRLTRIFGTTVRQEYHVPRRLMWRLLAKQFVKTPHLSLSIFFINSYCRLKALQEEKQMNAVWAIAQTTKGGIHHGQ